MFLLYLPLTEFTYYMTSCSDWSHCGNLAEKVWTFVFDRFRCQKQFFFFLARNVIMWESLFRFPFKRCHNFKKPKFCRINRGAESDKRQMPDRQWGRNFKCDATLNNTIQTSIIQSAQQHHMSGSGTVSCLALAVKLQSIFNGHIYVLCCAAYPADVCSLQVWHHWKENWGFSIVTTRKLAAMKKDSLTYSALCVCACVAQLRCLCTYI